MTAPLATVTPIRTPRPGYLPTRWADAGRVYPHPVHRCMAVIEDQAAIAWEGADGDPEAAYQLLASSGCRFTPAQVERLFALSQAARDAEDGPVRAWHDALDSYADLLHHLALETRTAVQA